MVYDILIIGGGMVGASLSAALKTSGLSIALVETRHAPLDNTGWDSRIYAISPGNAAYLETCGAWQKIAASRVEPIEEMRIFGDTGAELDFSAYEIGTPELAFILEGRQMQHALWEVLKAQENLTLFCPAECKSLVFEEGAAHLELADGRAVSARLIVGADGRDSWVRREANIIEPPTLYQQHGVVANFHADKPHRGTAYQWFKPDGILALLPMPGQLVSMVWSVSPEKAETLSNLPHGELCERVAVASEHRLGNLKMETPPAAFPLRLLGLPQIVKPRLALIGDAAHNIHPLSGQGVNLGYRDARRLAEVLIHRGPQPDCGNFQLLRRYERSRREDILATRYSTDTLKKLFINDNPILRTARNTGLRATNQFTPLKKMLARHALN